MSACAEVFHIREYCGMHWRRDVCVCLRLLRLCVTITMSLTSVPAALRGALVVRRGAGAVGPVRQASFLLGDVQLVLVIGVRARLHCIAIVSHCTGTHGGTEVRMTLLFCINPEKEIVCAYQG